MSSRLLRDPPHPRTTKKASASAAAVQLLLRRGGRAAAKDESIEFFSALRECQPDPRLSGQTGIGPADRSGKARRSGGDGELLSAEIGKHDYDWLLTPPETPPAATSGATAALNRLTRATSASFAKSNSPLSLARRENEYPTSRLARSSSTTHSSSVNTPAFASSCRPSIVRTLSSVSSSSIKAASNASSSGSAATSPRTPATARSKAQRRKVSSSSGATSQPKGSSSSNSGPSAPTMEPQPRAPTTTSASSPKSTGVASEQPALTTRRGANAVARSRFASQLSSAMSTAQPAQNVVRSSIIKPRPVPAAVNKYHGNGTAATASMMSSAINASLSTSRGDLLANKRLSSSGDYGRKINVDKLTTPRRTAGLASGSGLPRTGSRKSANADAKRTVNDDLKPTVQQRSIHSSMASRSRPAAGSIARGRWVTNQKGKVTAVARVAEAEAFPSTRYDAMLLQEDPKNLTWLNGCGDEDLGSCGVGLIAGSLELEPFNVTVAGTSGTTA